MVAVADLHHHRDFNLLSARHRFKRRKRRGLHDVVGRRNLGRQQVWEQQTSCRQQHADREPQIHVRFEFHTVTSLPICCEITRLITSKRFSPVFSSTNELFVSDQPSLKLVESAEIDRKSTRLNSSHQIISYAVFCLKKKKTSPQANPRPQT